MAKLEKDITYCYQFFPDSAKVIAWVFIVNSSKSYEFTD